VSVTGFFLKTASLRLKEGDIKPFYVSGQQNANEVLQGTLSVEEALGRTGMVNASRSAPRYSSVEDYDPVLRAHCRIDG
jgi:hypothetical protein